MNNSFLAIEHEGLSTTEKDMSPILREEEGKIVKILGAIQDIKETKAWGTLKTEVFEGFAHRLEKEIASEAKKESPNTLTLRYLSGQLAWAERYADLSKLEEKYRLELSRIRNKLYVQKE